MRKYLYTAAVAALALAIAIPTQAAEEKAAKKEAAPAAKQITGAIEKVDAATMIVTLKNAKGESTDLVCNEKTKIKTVDKKEGAALADLKVGDKIVAKYVEEAGKNIAKSIAPPAPPKPKKEEPKKNAK